MPQLVRLLHNAARDFDDMNEEILCLENLG